MVFAINNIQNNLRVNSSRIFKECLMNLLSMIYVGLGIALMYFLDPQMGRRRRALLRDQIVRFLSRTPDRVEVRTEYIAEKARGIAVETLNRLKSEPVSDDVLHERIHAHMGRIVTHPRAIEVSVNDGKVTLTGDILVSEVQAFVSHVKTMQGVSTVVNQLVVYQNVEGVSSLQGGSPRPDTP
jgi:hypothetical protein